MICDYYLVRRGYFIIQDLYRAGNHTTYRYTYGFSWRGYTAYICGILINIVGFVGAIGRKVPKGATYVYNVNFFGGFLVSAGVYYALCWWKPVPGCSDTWMEVGERVRNPSVAYGAEEGDSRSGSDDVDGVGGYGVGGKDKDVEATGVRERKVD